MTCSPKPAGIPFSAPFFSAVTYRLYRGYVDAVFDKASSIMFDLSDLKETCQTIAQTCKTEEDAMAIAETAKPRKLKILSFLESRKMLLLFENGIISFEHGLIPFLMQTAGLSREMFVKEDPRILLQGTGPGHNGESTLSKERGDEQQQTRDPEACLKRKRAKP